MTESVLISLGSNLDRTQAFREVKALLSTHFPDIRFSALVESPAYGFEGPDFYNGVAQFSTQASLEAVSSCLKGCEAQICQSQQSHSMKNRRMDIDLLTFGAQICSQTPLPRPDILRFAFVALPLAQLCPDWVHPVSHESIQTIVSRLDTRQVSQVHPDA